MARPVTTPTPIRSYVPPAKPRVIIVSETTDDFAERVYGLGLDPSTAYRACSDQQAAAMRQQWQARGIESDVIPLATITGPLEP